MGLMERMSLNSVEKAKPEVKSQNVAPDIKDKVHNSVIDLMNKLDVEVDSGDRVKEIIEEALAMEVTNISRGDKSKIAQEIYDDVMGYGPLENFLRDVTVTEIMVNGPKQIYIEKSGKLQLSDLTFKDNQHVLNIIDRIVSTIGRHIDEASPMVDARLKDGSRVNAIIPPLSLVGPVITIRKFSKTPIGINKLIEFGSLNTKMASFLEAAVKGKLNIIVAGGTGSGKTTLLNVLSSFIPENERIITIEDAAELQLTQEHIVSLESRPSNLEGQGEISIRNLLKNSLRMRPDRIIIGEVRSGETLDMLQAMNTGHDGSLTTLHSNSPRDTLSRIEMMVMMSGMELPLKAIREQVASSINLIVQQARLRDGTRKITNITEVLGMEGDIIALQDIFRYETDGQMDTSHRFTGRFAATGVIPQCLKRISDNGVAVSTEWFSVR